MANTFKSYLTAGVTVESNIHVAPSSTQTTVIGLSLANVGTGLATITVTLTRGATVVNIVKNAQIPVGDTLILYGGDQKLVMEADDVLKLTSDVAIDSIVSVLEIS